MGAMSAATPKPIKEDSMFPDVSEREWKDLEREAGHPLLSKRAVHEFRLRKITSGAVDAMLEVK
jgi:hypothetical protein